MNVTFTRGCLLATVLFTLAGCNDGKEKISPSQVLARVNDAEITVHQLNFLLAQQKTTDGTTKQKLLDELVNQELLLQRATAMKLDRDPTVLQAIDFSRRQILAQAAAERDLHPAAAPASADIDDFYAKNPMLFAERKVYDFEIFQLAGAKAPADLQAMLDKSKSVEQTRSLLTAAGIVFTSTDGKRPAEQMPLDNLEKFAAMQNGDILLVKQAEGYTLFQLKEAVAAPMSLQEATPSIRGYLEGAANQKAVENQYAALKRTAKIEVLRRFTEPTAAQPASNAAAAGDKDHLSAGLKGLHQ